MRLGNVLGTVDQKLVSEFTGVLHFLDILAHSCHSTLELLHAQGYRLHILAFLHLRLLDVSHKRLFHNRNYYAKPEAADGQNILETFHRARSSSPQADESIGPSNLLGNQKLHLCNSVRKIFADRRSTSN